VFVCAGHVNVRALLHQERSQLYRARPHGEVVTGVVQVLVVGVRRPRRPPQRRARATINRDILPHRGGAQLVDELHPRRVPGVRNKLRWCADDDVTVAEDNSNQVFSEVLETPGRPRLTAPATREHARVLSPRLVFTRARLLWLGA
jgi:hypothetical protein